MKTLYTYDLDGSKRLETIQSTHDVFRKYLDVTDTNHMTEYEIAKRIYHNPQKNIVRVYNVVKYDNECYYDMEYLQSVCVSKHDIKHVIREAVNQLHHLSIVYLDFKIDNVGFSLKDRTYKLIDFDCSGIVDIYNRTKWLIPPASDSHMWKDISFMNVNTLFDYDTIALEKMYS